MISEQDQEKLEKLFSDGACRVKTEFLYWIGGEDDEGMYDGGTDYCYNCCKKEVEKLQTAKPENYYFADGGWDPIGGSDSQPFCETCGVWLITGLTDYCCESEVEHFSEHGFEPRSSDDCMSMSSVIDSRGWKGRSEKYFNNLYALCSIILENLKRQDPQELRTRNQRWINASFCPGCDCFVTSEHQYCQVCGFELYPF